VTNYDNSLFDVYTRNKGNVSAGYIYVEVDFEMACGEAVLKIVHLILS